MNKQSKMIENFDTFSLRTFKTLFLLMPVAGSIGIFISNIIAGFLYTGFVAFSFAWLLNVVLCTHCPYPCDHNDCLFMPVDFVKKYFKYKSPHMNFIEKFLTVIIFLGIGIIPLYWVVKNIYVLMPFLILFLYCYSYMFFGICRRCYHYSCPFNRAKKTGTSG